MRIKNGVEVIDKSYIEKRYRSPEWDKIINDVVAKFTLNSEQERAFHIVANHAYQAQTEQLKMYIGGMSGTGKSQVLKALIKFFGLHQESHHIVVVAPTGTAAVLLGISTYHSMFGINDLKDSQYNLSQIRARLVGVQYVFCDEISMLSCQDLF
jgi:hypothetical protein